MDHRKHSSFTGKIGIFFLFVVLCWLLCAVPANAKNNGFWATWGDDRAEVSSYQLTQSRYGELREGRATLIFVAEPMLRTTRVKPDGHPSHVEDGDKRRVIAWEGQDGEKASLTGSERMQYWKLNRNRHEVLLKRLGAG